GVAAALTAAALSWVTASGAGAAEGGSEASAADGGGGVSVNDVFGDVITSNGDNHALQQAAEVFRVSSSMRRVDGRRFEKARAQPYREVSSQKPEAESEVAPAAVAADPASQGFDSGISLKRPPSSKYRLRGARSSTAGVEKGRQVNLEEAVGRFG
ncbi:unnamed protein product, partial [Sphacelaria rigidula]